MMKKGGLHYPLIGIIVFAALLFRCRSAWGDLWLDEIWSLKMSLSVQSLFEIITSIHHDNNHYLNTILFYILGDKVPGIYYRIPSCLAGVGTVIAATLFLKVEKAQERLSNAIIFALSYWMIHYSSEARGYSYLAFFTVLAIGYIQRYLDANSEKLVVGFTLVSIFGFLSHLTFIHTYIALFTWAVFTWRTQKKDVEQIVKECLVLFGPSCAFVLFLYVVDLRFLQIGGGNQEPLWNTIFETLGWVILGNADSVFIATSVLFFAVVSVWALNHFRKSQNKQWILYAVGIVASPALFVIATQPPFLYPRYFVAPSVLFLLLFSSFLTNWYGEGGIKRFASFGLGAVFLFSNIYSTVSFWEVGRGNYSAALNRIVSNSQEKISLGSDHDFRNSTVIGYYARSLPEGKSINYFPRGSWTDTDPQWLLYHQFDPAIVPLEELPNDKEGAAKYKLDSFYPSSKLSGWSWALYRRSITLQLQGK